MGVEIRPLVPCEVTVKKVLPAVRAALSHIMVKDLGMSLYDAAKALDVTPAAVSNYISGKRGKELSSILLANKRYRLGLKGLASRLLSKDAGLDDIVEFVCEICRDARRNKPIPPKIKREYEKAVKRN